MDEYIKRKDAFEILQSRLDSISQMSYLNMDWHELDIMRNAIENAIDDVGEVPAADVQPVNQWISVDDRLPSIDERVFVYIPRPDDHYNIEMAYISEGDDDYPYWVLRDKSQFYSTRFHYISHWQPLPEPPKDGETE